jgi:hypothetical protein
MAEPQAGTGAKRTRTSSSRQVPSASALYSGDGDAYCAWLTERAAAHFVRENKTEKTCAATVRALVPKPVPAAARATYKGRVVSIKIDGDEAVVLSRGVDGANDTTNLVKQDGKWKVDGYKARNPDKPGNPALSEKGSS